MSAKPGRNDFCPCGSGKKYKNCCESGVSGLRNKRLSQLLLGVLLIVGLAAVSTAYVNVSGENVKTSDLARPSVNVTPSSDHPPVENVKLIPQPPGPAPEGKVWSAEHGHWHIDPNAAASRQTINTSSGTLTPVSKDELPFSTDNLNIKMTPADPATNNSQASETPAKYYPPPPGPAPEGKIWSTEHGHWHTAAEERAGHGELIPQPPGPAPPGKVWSPEHGHWHGPPSPEELANNPEFVKRNEERMRLIKERTKANAGDQQQKLNNKSITLPPTQKNSESTTDNKSTESSSDNK